MIIKKKQLQQILHLIKKCPETIKVPKTISVSNGEHSLSFWVEPGNTDNISKTGVLKPFTADWRNEHGLNLPEPIQTCMDKVVGDIQLQHAIRGYNVFDVGVVLVLEMDSHVVLFYMRVDALEKGNV